MNSISSLLKKSKLIGTLALAGASSLNRSSANAVSGGETLPMSISSWVKALRTSAADEILADVPAKGKLRTALSWLH
jgi:hypothetical protein